MKKAILVVAGLTLTGAARLSAQGAPLAAPVAGCSSQATAAQDACQQTYDMYQFMAPQLGSAIAGGNATIGQGSTLGGLGHFSIGVRVNAVQGAYPDVTNYTQGVTGATRKTLTSKDQFLPFPTADVAIGLFGGVPLGVTNILAVDGLVSATYVPNYSSNNFSVKPDQNFQFGYGAKLGLLQESIVVPGVAVTYLKRDLPTTSLQGTAGNNQLNINKLSVKTTSIRLVASKSFVIFGFAVGAGQDKLENSADINAQVTNVPVVGTATANLAGQKQDLTRTNIFGDISLNLPLFKIVGEAGQVSGGSVSTYNSFSAGNSDRSLQYFSLGVRFSL